MSAAEATQHDSAYSWLRLALSFAVGIVGNIGMWSVVVVLPGIQDEFGVGRADVTFPVIGMMLGFALGNLFLGRAIDRWGITPVLVCASLSGGISFAMSAWASSILSVSFWHFFVGFAAASCFGPLIADASQWFLKHRGIAVAIAASSNYVSGSVWPPVVAWIMVDHGWRAAYLFLAVLVVLVVVPGAFLLRRKIDAETSARATSVAAVKAQEIAIKPQNFQWLLGIAGIGCCVAMSMPQVHIVALCIDRGFGAVAGAEMLSLMLIGGVISRLTFGVMADRLGGMMTLLIGSFLQMVALCLFLINGGIVSLYLISLAFGLAQGGIVPSYAIIVREYMPPVEAGKRVGIVLAITIAGMALGGWMSGWLYDVSGSYDLAIWNGVGWNLMNLVIIILILLRLGNGPKAVPANA